MLHGIIASMFMMSISTTQATETMLARSNGELTSQVPGRYHMLNLLDRNPKPIWCLARLKKTARIKIVFSGSTTKPNQGVCEPSEQTPRRS